MGRPRNETPTPRCTERGCRRVAKKDGKCLKCIAKARAFKKAMRARERRAAQAAFERQIMAEAAAADAAEAREQAQVQPAPTSPNGKNYGVRVLSAPAAPASQRIPIGDAAIERLGRLQAEVALKRQAADLLDLRKREAVRLHEEKLADLEKQRVAQIAEAQALQEQCDQLTANIQGGHDIPIESESAGAGEPAGATTN